MSELHQMLGEPFVQAALFAVTMLGACCGILGCFVVLRRQAFLADALAHAMLAGLVAAYLIVQWLVDGRAERITLVLGAALAALACSLLTHLAQRAGRIKPETAIGISYAGIFAAGGALASIFADRITTDLYSFMGSLVAVDAGDLWLATTLLASILTAVLLLYRSLQLLAFDPITAAGIGLPVRGLQALLTGLCAMTVVIGVQMVGVVLIVGLLVIPPAAALRLARSMVSMIVWSAGLAVLSCWMGLLLSLWTQTAPGASIILSATAVFLAVMLFGPGGWVWSLGSGSPAQRDQHEEDLLIALLRHGADRPDAAIPAGKLALQQSHRPADLRQALRGLLEHGLACNAPGGLHLSALGLQRALRVQRAHRLWETYLDRVARVPPAQVHPRAEQLEHLNDPATLAYLDHRLDHPDHDPHGAAIPQSEYAATRPEVMMRVSALRHGQTGYVVAVDDAARLQPAELLPGTQLQLIQRQPAEDRWTIQTDNHRIDLTHRQADGLIVRVPIPSPHSHPAAQPTT